MNDAIQFHKTDHYIFALSERENHLELFISSLFGGPMGGDYHFIPIKITDSNLKEHGFTILEAKHGVIVLNINHKGGESNSGNIYISDY